MKYLVKLAAPLSLLLILMMSCSGSPESAMEKEQPLEVVPKADEQPQPVEDSKEPEYRTERVTYYQVSRESYFLDDGTENGFKVFSYDEEGRIVFMENYRGSGDLLFKEEYFYDDQGRVVKSELYDAEGITSYTLFRYSDDDLLTDEEYYNHRDVYLSGSTYEYDGQGNKLLWVSLDDKKSPVLKAEYIYKEEKLIKVAFLTPLDKEDGSIDYTYEGDMLVKELSIASSGKEERRTEYVYEGDRLSEEKLFQLGRLSRVNKMEYDERGVVVKKNTYNRSGNLLSSTNYDYLSFEKEIQVLVK